MANQTDLKLFNKYSFDEVIVKDESLKPIINVQKKCIIPHCATKVGLNYFGKIHTSIIERFITHLMSHARNAGKKRMAIKLFQKACEIIEAKGLNPIQVLVDAVVFAGPREISARVGRGGNMKRASVDVSPYKRVAKGLQFLADSIRDSAFKNKKHTMPEVMAYELMACATASSSSMAYKKKGEVERIAKSNR